MIQPSKRAWALPLLALLPLTLAVTSAQEKQERQEGREREGQGEQEGSPLHQTMEGIQRRMRLVGRSMRSGEGGDAVLGAVVEMKAGFLKAFELMPEAPEELVDEAGLVKHHIAYQREILKTLDLVLQFDESMRLGETEQAQAIYQQLREQKELAHDAFQVEDDD